MGICGLCLFRLFVFSAFANGAIRKARVSTWPAREFTKHAQCVEPRPTLSYLQVYSISKTILERCIQLRNIKRAWRECHVGGWFPALQSVFDLSLIRYFVKSSPADRFCPFGNVNHSVNGAGMNISSGRDCFYQHCNDDGTPYVFQDGVEAMMRVRNLLLLSSLCSLANFSVSATAIDSSVSAKPAQALLLPIHCKLCWKSWNDFQTAWRWKRALTALRIQKSAFRSLYA